jgi:hypothetical protein
VVLVVLTISWRRRRRRKIEISYCGGRCVPSPLGAGNALAVLDDIRDAIEATK